MFEVRSLKRSFNRFYFSFSLKLERVQVKKHATIQTPLFLLDQQRQVQEVVQTTKSNALRLTKISLENNFASIFVSLTGRPLLLALIFAFFNDLKR